jgi:hypothetical protein
MELQNIAVPLWTNALPARGGKSKSLDGFGNDRGGEFPAAPMVRQIYVKQNFMIEIIA